MVEGVQCTIFNFRKETSLTERIEALWRFSLEDICIHHLPYKADDLKKNGVKQSDLDLEYEDYSQKFLIVAELGDNIEYAPRKQAFEAIGKLSNPVYKDAVMEDFNDRYPTEIWDDRVPCNELAFYIFLKHGNLLA